MPVRREADKRVEVRGREGNNTAPVGVATPLQSGCAPSADKQRSGMHEPRESMGFRLSPVFIYSVREWNWLLAGACWIFTVFFFLGGRVAWERYSRDDKYLREVLEKAEEDEKAKKEGSVT